MADIMTLQNIEKFYGDKIRTQVLFGIDLAIEAGSFNSIIGQSGSGKSTLMNIMGTLDQPSTGKVTIDGVETTQMTRKQLAVLRNRTIGFVFQFHYLLPEFTVIENVLMPYRIAHGTVSPEIRERAYELLETVELTRVADNKATEISGGQQQRTAIARALINSPKLLLADEPTGNLDSNTTETVYGLMREINKTLGTTLIVITHDRRVAEKADRILEIKDGRIEMDVRK
ncbi:MAG: ABC transporter ATP-binding protein [Clostridiaceae bacterium]|nr:ABC transporter ATP-binding protein [Clostridiaceae bacterium]